MKIFILFFITQINWLMNSFKCYCQITKETLHMSRTMILHDQMFFMMLCVKEIMTHLMLKVLVWNGANIGGLR